MFKRKFTHFHSLNFHSLVQESKRMHFSIICPYAGTEIGSLILEGQNAAIRKNNLMFKENVCFYS